MADASAKLCAALRGLPKGLVPVGLLLCSSLVMFASLRSDDAPVTISAKPGLTEADGDAAASKLLLAREPVDAAVAGAHALSVASAGTREEAGVEGWPTSAYSFKTFPPASLSWSDPQVVKGCSRVGIEYELLKSREPVASDLPVLLLIGQQKGGSTWFFSLLEKHPAIVSAYEPEGTQVKELHWLTNTNKFFPWNDTDSTAYSRAFTDQLDGDGMQALRERKRIMLDGTPMICRYPSAPRAHAMVPQAKLVVILRDPVARMLSAYRMNLHRSCYSRGLKPGQDCSYPPIDKWIEARLEAADLIPATVYPQLTEEEEPRSFQDIYCKVRGSRDRTSYSSTFEAGSYDDFTLCSTHTAPQLAWWLGFYPPERFLIFTSDQLHNKAESIAAADRVLEHAGVVDAVPFTEEMHDAAVAFSGEKHPEPDISLLIPKLRALFEQPMAELTAFINEHWPEMDFKGIPNEV